MSTNDELRNILRNLPEGTPPVRPVVLAPVAHTATTVEYWVNVPEGLAGTMLGVRWPKDFPHKGAQLLSGEWEGGESVVEGLAPLHTGRKLKFWSTGGQRLKVVAAPPAGRSTAAIAKDMNVRPYSLLVPPDLSGATQLQKEWKHD